ncbi:MAG: DUF4838 domain-containing protein [Planctomycetes bacterium]|nr:DUF4838 domain-containing protein [Planctomycetota bacterium]
MDRIRRAMGIAGIALLAAARIPAAELIIVEDGAPRATIVIAKDAGEKAKRAAAELATYIEKISDAKLAIATDDAPPAGPLVLVGASALAKDAGIPIPSGVTNARREEGFVIATAGDRLVLAGNEDGPYHGTEYAVYDFLRMLGVRWFMPGAFGEVVPRRATIAVGPLRIEERPDFVMRNWWLHAKPDLAQKERVWKLRNKMNPEAMFATPGDSSVRNVLPRKVYEEHPEYFASNPDGSRNPHLPNLTHPGAVETVAGVIREYFRKNPDANSYGFAPDDGLPRDYSPETVSRNRGFVELGGRPGVPGELSISEEWFGFVNRVAAAVREEFPDTYIATNGYANRDFPPQGMAIDDHLVVMFAAIWSCTLHAYDDEHCWQKVRQGQMLRRWCQMCPNVWIYGYNYGMLVSALTPLPMVHKLRRDFPLMKEWGVMGFLDEARNVWAECGIISRYLRAQLEWDAEADVDAILADFYAKWYGEAAGPMRAFHECLEAAVEDAPIHGHEDRVLPEVYTPGMMAKLRASIAEAERRAGADPFRIRVRADRLIFDHLESYVAMSAAEAAGAFAEAARQADRMLAIRKELHAIDPFFIWYDEERYHSGIWYWGLAERKAFYASLADRISGKTGDLVALVPEEAGFRTDPHDEGLFAGWYAPDLDGKGWGTIRTTRPFYVQGFQDERGHPFVGPIWYRLRADVPASAAGRKVILHVPIVETEAWCWVNGIYAGHRPYLEAYVRPSAVELDVSDAIRPGESNAIAIRVSTSLSPAQAASGLLSRVILYAPK